MGHIELCGIWIQRGLIALQIVLIFLRRRFICMFVALLYILNMICWIEILILNSEAACWISVSSIQAVFISRVTLLLTFRSHIGNVSERHRPVYYSLPIMIRITQQENMENVFIPHKSLCMGIISTRVSYFTITVFHDNKEFKIYQSKRAIRQILIAESKSSYRH